MSVYNFAQDRISFTSVRVTSVYSWLDLCNRLHEYAALAERDFEYLLAVDHGVGRFEGQIPAVAANIEEVIKVKDMFERRRELTDLEADYTNLNVFAEAVLRDYGCMQVLKDVKQIDRRLTNVGKYARHFNNVIGHYVDYLLYRKTDIINKTMFVLAFLATVFALFEALSFVIDHRAFLVSLFRSAG